MANLNFQQRSIPNASLTGRTTGGFGGSSLSGHVTPTSGMFPTGAANYGQTQPQLSPNRNAQISVGGPALSSNRPTIFNQRFNDRRTIPGIGGVGNAGGPMSNVNFMQTTVGGRSAGFPSSGNSGSGGASGMPIGGGSGGSTGAANLSAGAGSGGGGGPLNSFHNVYGGTAGDVTQTPALLDPSEFPSLTNTRGQNDQTLPQTNPLQPPGSKPYVGMVKQPTSEQSEFTMSNEDFPALPGTQNSDGTTNPGMPGDSPLVLDSTEKGINSIVIGSNSGLGAVGSGGINSVTNAVNVMNLGGSGGSGVISNSSNSSNNNNQNSNSSNSNNAGPGTIGGVINAVNPSIINAMSSAVQNSSNNPGVNMTGLGGVVGPNSIINSGTNGPNSGNVNNSVNTVAVSVQGPGIIQNVMSGAVVCPGGSNLLGVSNSGNNSNGLISGNNIDHHNENSNNDKLVQTYPDGKVTNIPASMVNNQFGMVGLLTFIRASESDPNLVTLALGTDLTGLGLNLNSQGDLHPTFAGPFADQPCRAQDVEYNVPPEYLINFAIRDKLSSPVMKKLHDDLLFFLFYTNIGDIMQVMAAIELHSRDWRYHIEEKIWITRMPGINHYEKSGTKERGTYYYFDAQSWKRLSKVFQVDSEKLDKCPSIGTLMNMNGQSV